MRERRRVTFSMSCVNSIVVNSWMMVLHIPNMCSADSLVARPGFVTSAWRTMNTKGTASEMRFMNVLLAHVMTNHQHGNISSKAFHFDFEWVLLTHMMTSKTLFGFPPTFFLLLLALVLHHHFRLTRSFATHGGLRYRVTRMYSYAKSVHREDCTI